MMIIVIWLICGVVTAVIANDKNRNPFGWFLIGVLIGFFGIILIALLSEVEEADLNEQ